MTRRDKAIDALRKAGFTANEVMDMLRVRGDLRAEFAGRAAQGLVVGAVLVDTEKLAKVAVALADDLLKELLK